MGSYQDSYTYVLALLQQDIRDTQAKLDENAEDQFLMGKLRGLEWAVENLQINQPNMKTEYTPCEDPESHGYEDVSDEYSPSVHEEYMEALDRAEDMYERNMLDNPPF